MNAFARLQWIVTRVLGLPDTSMQLCSIRVPTSDSCLNRVNSRIALHRSLLSALVLVAGVATFYTGLPAAIAQETAPSRAKSPIAVSQVAEPELKPVSNAAAKPQFEDGQAVVVDAFKDPESWIRHDLFVETEFDSDGDGKLDRVHVAVTRPQQTDTEGLKVPVIYTTSPYFAGTSGAGDEYMWNARHALNATPPKRDFAPTFDPKGERPIISRALVRDWVPRGFAVVHSSSPGTGLSQGCPTVGGVNESLAPKAVIDWLCGRAKGFTEVDNDEEVKADWCTGKVGMTGTSYNGTLPIAAATTGVEGLEAIIPVAPNTSYYHYYRSNGLVRHPGGYMGEDIDVLYEFIRSGNPDRREYCDCEVRDEEMAEGMDRVTGDYNEFWAGRDYLNQMDGFNTALLMSHGFNDWNVMPEHSLRIYEAAKAKGLPTRIYYHQGGHGGPPPMEMMNRWFSRFLYDVKNGVEDEPKSYIVREGDARDEPTVYPDYPHPDSAEVRLHLTGGAPERGVLQLDAPESQGTETLVDNFSFSGKVLATAESTNHRLLFVTPKLTEPLHISGTARLKIRLACNATAANLSVWLVSLPWDDGRDAKITDNIVTRGWADPQNAESLSASDLLEPGKFYDLEFELQPDDQILPEGQQLGLMIFSSDREFTLQPEPGTQLTIDLDATQLILPVVGGAGAFNTAANKAQ